MTSSARDFSDAGNVPTISAQSLLNLPAYLAFKGVMEDLGFQDHLGIKMGDLLPWLYEKNSIQIAPSDKKGFLLHDTLHVASQDWWPDHGEEERVAIFERVLFGKTLTDLLHERADYIGFCPYDDSLDFGDIKRFISEMRAEVTGINDLSDEDIEQTFKNAKSVKALLSTILGGVGQFKIAMDAYLNFPALMLGVTLDPAKQFDYPICMYDLNDASKPHLPAEAQKAFASQKNAIEHIIGLVKQHPQITAPAVRSADELRAD